MDETGHNDAKEIFFVADPMCSWCWGFSPVITAIDETGRGRAKITLVVGGLRPGTTEAMDEGMKATIRHHWEEVGRASDQPFSFEFFERQGFVYDTEPACRAAVTVRRLAPEATLPYFATLHRAFYVDGEDTTDPATLGRLAEEFGVDRKAFAEEFASDDMKRATLEDFQFSRRLGVTGFPTVVVNDHRGYAYLSMGFRSFEALQPHLETWLNS
ncbi:MAG: DsbA family protein [Rhodospirillales bacterium]|jgi:putative protein-disulfide isomerase|nr:DsbA family protein [Rhodospirillales bacterium]HJO71548.1 DsbA family protein [Rhodospirillales bacterium]